jgi:hypothetical protein
MRSGGVGTRLTRSVLPQKRTTFAKESTPRFQWICKQANTAICYSRYAGLSPGEWVVRRSRWKESRVSLNGLSVCAFAEEFHPQRCVWSCVLRLFPSPRSCQSATLPVQYDRTNLDDIINMIHQSPLVGFPSRNASISVSTRAQGMLAWRTEFAG